MSHVNLSPIDEVRRKLRDTERELAQTRSELDKVLKAAEELQEENLRLKTALRRTGQHVEEKNSSWKIYDAPGVCGFCGSTRCRGSCVR